MRARCIALGLTLLPALAMSASLAAQDTTLLVPGVRVRITPRTAPTEIGIFLSFRADTLRYWRQSAAADTAAISFAQIDWLEVSRGKRHRPWHGLGIGALAGGAIGAIVGAATYKTCHTDVFGGCIMSTRGAHAVAGAALGAAGGGLIGLAIGATVRSEHWQRIPVDHLRGHVRLEPAFGRPGIAITVGLAM